MPNISGASLKTISPHCSSVHSSSCLATTSMMSASVSPVIFFLRPIALAKASTQCAGYPEPSRRFLMRLTGKTGITSQRTRHRASVLPRCHTHQQPRLGAIAFSNRCADLAHHRAVIVED